MSLPILQLSHLYHYLKYLNSGLKRPNVKLDTGVLITSIDVDVGSKKLAIMNGGKNDAYVNDRLTEYQVATIEELAIPLFVDLFEKLNLPVTFAIRGQLLEVGKDVLIPLLQTSVKHEIGSHGYSHRSFTYLSRDAAEIELRMASSLMNRCGLSPKSFIFPRNKIAHLDMLSQYGYKCYRGKAGFHHDGMYIRKHDQIYDVHPSLCLGKGITPFFPMKMLDICISKKLPMHVWLHLWSFGSERSSIEKSIRKVLFPFFDYARRKVEKGELSFETMSSAVMRLEAIPGQDFKYS